MGKRLNALAAVVLAVAVFAGIAGFSVKETASAAEVTFTTTFRSNSKQHEKGGYATGWLYGLSEENVPSLESIEALKPKTLVSKNKDGLQHPTGDIWRVADTFLKAGGEMLQVYSQDYYPDFPYNGNVRPDMNEYFEAAILPTLNSINESPNKDKWTIVLFNESDWIWFDHDGSDEKMTIFNESWEIVYNLVKEVCPDIRIIGPNFAYYDANGMNKFMRYAKDNDCLPDIVSWHELTANVFNESWYDHLSNYRNLEEALGIEKRMITINEYAESKQCSVPGELVKYIVGLEREQAYGCMPYWNIANNMNDTVADYNTPNASWYLYKWYADMEGYVYNSQYEGVGFNGRGLTTVSNETDTIYTVLGGQSGDVTLNYTNLASLSSSVLKSAAKLHVKIETAHWSGYDGAQDYIHTLFDKDVDVVNGKLTVPLTGLNRTDAYRAVITAATGVDNETLYSTTIEAENNAVIMTNASTKTRSQLDSGAAGHFSVSNSSDDIQDINTVTAVEMNAVGSKIAFSINVPADGVYKVDMLYGTKTRNYMTQTLTVDSKEPISLSLEPTITILRGSKKSIYLTLTEGEHKLTFANAAGANLMVDRFDIYQIADQTPVSPAYTLNTADSRLTGGAARSGASAITLNEGTARFITVAEKSGMYKLTLKGEGSMSAEVNHIAHSVYAADDEVYLERGVNILDITGENAQLEGIELEYKDDVADVTAEFEDGTLTGSAAQADSSAASGGKYVTIGSGAANKVELSVNAAAAGIYKLVVYYSSNDAKGSHIYNIDTIDPYVQLSLNGADAKTYYFRSTYHWDCYRMLTIDVQLNAGANTLTFYNDNSYRYNGILDTDDPAPRLDKIELFALNKAASINYDPTSAYVEPTEPIEPPVDEGNTENNNDNNNDEGGCGCASSITMTVGGALALTLTVAAAACVTFLLLRRKKNI